MKKRFLIEIYRTMLIILFAYTATSKFLDYGLFVFQMRLAPLSKIATYGKSNA